jgi:hypothetical protein
LLESRNKNIIENWWSGTSLRRDKPAWSQERFYLLLWASGYSRSDGHYNFSPPTLDSHVRNNKCPKWQTKDSLEKAWTCIVYFQILGQWMSSNPHHFRHVDIMLCKLKTSACRNAAGLENMTVAQLNCNAWTPTIWSRKKQQSVDMHCLFSNSRTMDVEQSAPL